MMHPCVDQFRLFGRVAQNHMLTGSLDLAHVFTYSRCYMKVMRSKVKGMSKDMRLHKTRNDSDPSDGHSIEAKAENVLCAPLWTLALYAPLWMYAKTVMAGDIVSANNDNLV